MESSRPYYTIKWRGEKGEEPGESRGGQERSGEEKRRWREYHQRCLHPPPP